MTAPRLCYLTQGAAPRRNGGSRRERMAGMAHRVPIVRRRWPVAVALAAGLLVAACTAEQPRPNVILIVVDALRQDALGFYGAERPTTPFLDRLASESVVFDRAYAQGSSTFTSTGSLFSGRYAPLLAPPPDSLPQDELKPDEVLRHRLVPALAQEELTLAELLTSAGYDTVAIFTNPHHHSRSGFWQGFQEARYLPRDPGTAYARASSVHRAFFDWLGGRKDDRPVFAYLHLMDPHAPYRPPRVFRRLFVEDRAITAASRALPRQGVATVSDVRVMHALYDAEVRFTNGVLRDLIEDAREALPGPIVFILTADHGEEFLDHGGLGHGHTLHGELLRVPMLIHGSGVVPARFPELVRNLDLVPTILQLCGIPVPAGLDGESLAPVLRGMPAPSTPRSSFARGGSLWSLTTRDWHFLWDRGNDSVELFDLERDAGESRDLSRLRPDLVERFRDAILEQQEREAGRARHAGPLTSAAPADAKTVEQLRSLGYLDGG